MQLTEHSGLILDLCALYPYLVILLGDPVSLPVYCGYMVDNFLNDENRSL